MSKSAADKKAEAREAKRKAYYAWLEKRIPELHAEGVHGRLARTQADVEWGEQQNG